IRTISSNCEAGSSRTRAMPKVELVANQLVAAGSSGSASEKWSSLAPRAKASSTGTLEPTPPGGGDQVSRQGGTTAPPPVDLALHPTVPNKHRRGSTTMCVRRLPTTIDHLLDAAAHLSAARSFSTASLPMLPCAGRAPGTATR